MGHHPPPAAQAYHHDSLRMALLDAAEAILERDRLQALTLQAAFRAAGVSHAAPAHHFGDLVGLLSELAAIGYVRFRPALLTEMAAMDAAPKGRLHATGRGYVRFARDHPNLFLLMFRSERLDTQRPARSEAMHAAYGALAEATAASADASPVLRAAPATGTASSRLADIAAAWTIAHGLALLLIDGRLRTFTDEAGAEAFISAALSRLML